ncbi:MAG: CHAT domain-containing protein, partial [Bacteroidota bacterium]
GLRKFYIETAQGNSQLPDYLKERLDFVLANLYSLDRLLQKTPSEATEYAQIFAQYQTLQREHQALQDTLLDYRAYRREINEALGRDTDDVIAQLATNQCLLSYFLGPEKGFAFLVHPTGEIQMREIPLAPQDLTALAENFFALSARVLDRTSARKQWLTHNQALYTALLAPFEPQLAPRILIIPDQALYKLPFESLLKSSAVSAPADFDQLPYLLRDHAIGYHYSALALADFTASDDNYTYDFLGVAPSFSSVTPVAENLLSGRTQLSALRGSKELVRKISQVFEDGTTLPLLAADATVAQFLQYASQAKYIHLHTHGDYEDLRKPFLFFTDHQSADQVEKLYVADLIGQSIDARLITIPACYSGLGVPTSGQGLTSLGRGFLQAGAHSVLPSLWEGYSPSLSAITDELYQHLRQEMPLDVALQRAKLAYLESPQNKGNTAPFYWASYLPIGQMDERNDGGWQLGNWQQLVTYAGSAFLVLLILLWSLRRRSTA